jgi:hypothetical protein
MSVALNMSILQYDVKNAFVHADIDTDIYVIQPIGFETGHQKVCKLHKALYGLKQSPRLWYNHLYNTLKEYGFTKYASDEGVFVNNKNGIYIICHVDDLLIFAHTEQIIRDLVNKLTNLKIQEIGIPETFLGQDIKINKENKTLQITQGNFTHMALEKFRKYYPKGYRKLSTPSDGSILEVEKDTQATKAEITQYQQEVGSLIWLSTKTRPDITFTVNRSAKYSSNPNQSHRNALSAIWGYLEKNPEKGLFYNCNITEFILRGYSDADWANNKDDRKSVSGYITSLTKDNNLISWTSKGQKTIATSTTHAEYIALFELSKEIEYLNRTINDIKNTLYPDKQLGFMFCDSETAINIAKNPVHHDRTKHIDVNYHYIREVINNGEIALQPVRSQFNNADLFTKPLSNQPFHEILSRIMNKKSQTSFSQLH